MENLDQFRKDTKSWLEENCPPEMRKPMGPGDVVCGGRNCKFPIQMQNYGQKEWVKKVGHVRLGQKNMAEAD